MWLINIKMSETQLNDYKSYTKRKKQEANYKIKQANITDSSSNCWRQQSLAHKYSCVYD